MEIITFEQIYELVRNEKISDELSEVNPEIINQISNYLNSKENIIKDSVDKIIPSELEKIKTQLNSAKSLAKEFYERREKKIAMLALSMSKVHDVDTSHLLEHEKNFVLKLSKIMEEHRLKALEDMFSAKEVQSDEIPKDMKTDENAKEIQIKDTKETESLITLKFLSEQHKFYGPNLEIFGPFKEGDIANLPVIVADILINKNKAIKITEKI